MSYIALVATVTTTDVYFVDTVETLERYLTHSKIGGRKR